jgi:hypothetical protein
MIRCWHVPCAQDVASPVCISSSLNGFELAHHLFTDMLCRLPAVVLRPVAGPSTTVHVLIQSVVPCAVHDAIDLVPGCVGGGTVLKGFVDHLSCVSGESYVRVLHCTCNSDLAHGYNISPQKDSVSVYYLCLSFCCCAADCTDWRPL